MKTYCLHLMIIAATSFSGIASAQDASKEQSSAVRRVQVKQNAPAAPTAPPPLNIQMLPEKKAVSEAPNENPFVLKVVHDPKVNARALKMHQQAAEILTGAKLLPPQNRIDYFRSLYTKDSVDVIGWGAVVAKTSPTEDENGILVTVRVSAKLKMFVDTAYIYETYLVENGKIELVHSSFPSNEKRIIFR